MNKRIRYINTESPLLFKGSKFYKDNNNIEYEICFTKTEAEKCIGVVKNLNGEVIKEIRATSPHKIKIGLKKALMELGCEFEAETRSKGETE